MPSRYNPNPGLGGLLSMVCTLIVISGPSLSTTAWTGQESRVSLSKQPIHQSIVFDILVIPRCLMEFPILIEGIYAALEIMLTRTTDIHHRGILTTYSRQPQRVADSFNDDVPRKRIRMNVDGTVIEENLGPKAISEAFTLFLSEQPASSSTAPSSPRPAEDALFSDNAPANVGPIVQSPPSSPPPVFPSPEAAARRPAFSFLKRKRSAHGSLGSTNEPLSDIDRNPCKFPWPDKKIPLTQMQIDLGGEVRKTCRTCGMEYIPSSKEDAALHKDFHTMNSEGVDLGRTFLKDDGIKRVPPKTGSEGETMVVVDRRNALGVRNRVKKVLEVVNAELSAAEIKDDQLWGVLPPNPPNRSKQALKTRKARKEAPVKRRDRFKAFLYLVGDKCVGFCLAEKIVAAFQVINPMAENETSKIGTVSSSSSITTSAVADAATVGICRIWVSKSRRGQGIAIDLLNCARTNFFYGMEVPKEFVAFSQPTDSGGRLAKRWFEAETGWHVYKGDP